MKGKVCLITGGTNGIGLETARALAKMGAKVVIVGRNPQKTAEVVAELKRSTGSEHIDSLLGDLSLMTQVRKIADEFRAKYERLDVLINNAGGVYNSRQLTTEGYELTFALNHLSYFLLTNLLLDIVIDTAPARIINVSSDAHTMGRIDFENLNGEKKYSAFGAYGQSKLMNILFSNELARRLEGTGVTVNSLHPGFVGTGFGQNNGGLMSIVLLLMRPFSKSPEKGSATSVYLASSPAVASITGKYFADSKEKTPHPATLNLEFQRKLWDVSEKITGITSSVKV